jgi:galactitol-specific phosphotransferase system IIB component
MGKPRRTESRNSDTTQAENMDDNAQLKNDILEIKQTLSCLTDTVGNLNETVNSMKAELVGSQAKTNDLMMAVTELTKKLDQKDKFIIYLEQKINSLEQYQKKNNIIVTGANLHTFSHIVQRQNLQEKAISEEEELPQDEENSMKQNFINFTQAKLQVIIRKEEIMAIHKLQRRRDGVEPVLVRFVSNNTKRSIMTVRKRLKIEEEGYGGPFIYINDHLTEKNVEMDKKARKLRKDGKLYSNWTINGRIFVKESETGPKKEIKHINELINM